MDLKTQKIRIKVKCVRVTVIVKFVAVRERVSVSMIRMKMKIYHGKRDQTHALAQTHQFKTSVEPEHV